MKVSEQQTSGEKKEEINLKGFKTLLLSKLRQYSILISVIFIIGISTALYYFFTASPSYTHSMLVRSNDLTPNKVLKRNYIRYDEMEFRLNTLLNTSENNYNKITDSVSVYKPVLNAISTINCITPERHVDYRKSINYLIQTTCNSKVNTKKLEKLLLNYICKSPYVQKYLADIKETNNDFQTFLNNSDTLRAHLKKSSFLHITSEHAPSVLQDLQNNQTNISSYKPMYVVDSYWQQSGGTKDAGTLITYLISALMIIIAFLTAIILLWEFVTI